MPRTDEPEFVGRLQFKPNGFGYLKVPQPLIDGLYAAVKGPGIEPSPGTAHISVFDESEIQSLGGPQAIRERGQEFKFTLGRTRYLNPAGWREMNRVYFIICQSPELEKLRKGYGLGPRLKGHDFHITFAVRRANGSSSAAGKSQEPDLSSYIRKSSGADHDKLVHQLAEASSETDTSPSDKQKESGNYKKGEVNLHGMTIAIENPRGSTRSGTAPDGKTWETTMKHAYGYIRRIGGDGKIYSKADGDPVDVFIGPDPESDMVYVVDQIDPKTGRFDEHKALLGFVTEKDARDGYLANYERGWRGLGEINPLTVRQFKWWVRHGDTGRPLMKQKLALSGEKVAALFGGVMHKVGADTGWVATDLDGTLAHTEEPFDPESIGEPIPKMVSRVKRWLSEGKDVRILTARVADDPEGRQRKLIQQWCTRHLGRALPVTSEKDPGMTQLWDDRVTPVVKNEGTIKGAMTLPAWATSPTAIGAGIGGAVGALSDMLRTDDEGRQYADPWQKRQTDWFDRNRGLLMGLVTGAIGGRYGPALYRKIMKSMPQSQAQPATEAPTQAPAAAGETPVPVPSPSQTSPQMTTGPGHVDPAEEKDLEELARAHFQPAAAPVEERALQSLYHPTVTPQEHAYYRDILPRMLQGRAPYADTPGQEAALQKYTDLVYGRTPETPASEPASPDLLDAVLGPEGYTMRGPDVAKDLIGTEVGIAGIPLAWRSLRGLKGLAGAALRRSPEAARAVVRGIPRALGRFGTMAVAAPISEAARQGSLAAMEASEYDPSTQILGSTGAMTLPYPVVPKLMSAARQLTGGGKLLPAAAGLLRGSPTAISGVKTLGRLAGKAALPLAAASTAWDPVQAMLYNQETGKWGYDPANYGRTLESQLAQAGGDGSLGRRTATQALRGFTRPITTASALGAGSYQTGEALDEAIQRSGWRRALQGLFTGRMAPARVPSEVELFRQQMALNRPPVTQGV